MVIPILLDGFAALKIFCCDHFTRQGKRGIIQILDGGTERTTQTTRPPRSVFLEKFF